MVGAHCTSLRAAAGQRADLSSLVSEGFVRFFVELVGHYPLHMTESSGGSRELQRDSFRKSHPSRGVRQFLQLFMDTQMFAGFIQDKELRKSGGRGKQTLNKQRVMMSARATPSLPPCFYCLISLVQNNSRSFCTIQFLLL